MRHISEIMAIAAARKGGMDALMALVGPTRSARDLDGQPDSVWLTVMAKSIFQAGFSWKVIDTKWSGFEAAFRGFDPGIVAGFGPDDLDRLLADRGVVRNGAKLSAVIENAIFLRALAAKHGTANAFFQSWPASDQAGLLLYMRKNGARLGGATGQRVLRAAGYDAFVLSQDVVARLMGEAVVEKPPTSQRDMAAVQEMFNQYQTDSGLCYTQISRILAYSVGA